MIDVALAFVPSGGGDVTHTLPAQLPAIPHAGDRLSILRVVEAGHEHFKVRGVVWLLDPAEGQVEAVPYTGETFAGGNPYGGTPAKVRRIYVECEPVAGPWPTEAHARQYTGHQRAGLSVVGA